MAEVKKCAHPACTCIPPEKQKYCSEVCEDAKNMTELTCQCDHPACRGEALKALALLLEHLLDAPQRLPGSFFVLNQGKAHVLIPVFPKADTQG